MTEKEELLDVERQIDAAREILTAAELVSAGMRKRYSLRKRNRSMPNASILFATAASGRRGVKKRSTTSTCPARDLKTPRPPPLSGRPRPIAVPCSAETEASPTTPCCQQGKTAGQRGGHICQTQPASAAAVESWFARGCQSVAAIGGRVSGGLSCHRL